MGGCCRSSTKNELMASNLTNTVIRHYIYRYNTQNEKKKPSIHRVLITDFVKVK